MHATAPVLVTPPSAVPVSLSEARLHLRVDSTEEDALIEGLLAAAVGMLDGWGGLLGRGIMPQTWREEFDAWGAHVLRMPDVTGVTVTGFDAAGDEVAQSAAPELVKTPAGWLVICEGGAVEKIRVDYVVGLPAGKLPVVQAAIKMLVGHWYQNREAVASGMAEVPLSAKALIDTLRWRRL